MFGFSRYDRHADLVSRMSDVLGHDLVEETQRGNVTPGALRSTVANCIGCTQADDCDQWLAAHSSGAKAPPDYCRNGNLFAKLGLPGS